MARKVPEHHRGIVFELGNQYVSEHRLQNSAGPCVPTLPLAWASLPLDGWAHVVSPGSKRCCGMFIFTEPKNKTQRGWTQPQTSSHRRKDTQRNLPLQSQETAGGASAPVLSPSSQTPWLGCLFVSLGSRSQALAQLSPPWIVGDSRAGPESHSLWHPPEGPPHRRCSSSQSQGWSLGKESGGWATAVAFQL